MYSEKVLRNANFTDEAIKVINSTKTLSKQFKMNITLECLVGAIIKFYQEKDKKLYNSIKSHIGRNYKEYLCKGFKNGCEKDVTDFLDFLSETPGEKDVNILFWGIVTFPEKFQRKVSLITFETYTLIRDIVQMYCLVDTQSLNFYKGYSNQLIVVLREAYSVAEFLLEDITIDILLYSIWTKYPKRFKEFMKFYKDIDDVNDKAFWEEFVEFYFPESNLPGYIPYFSTIASKFIKEKTIRDLREFFIYLIELSQEYPYERKMITKLITGYIPSDNKRMFTSDKISDSKISNKSIYTNKLEIPPCVDLTYEAYNQKFKPLIGRESELKRSYRILSKFDKNNFVLVGPSGSGKTHIVQEIANRFCKGDYPYGLENYRVLALNPSSWVAGSKYRGDLEEKILSCIEKIKKEKNIVLFIDELHTICHSQGEGVGSVSDILKPILLDNDIIVIGATTWEEYRILEKDSAILRRFEKIRIEESTTSETIEILKQSKPYYENGFDIKISDSVIENCVKLADRYISSNAQPDKSFDVLSETCSYVKNELENVETLETEHLCQIITEKTGIPINFVKSTEKENLIKLHNCLKSKIIGQEESADLIISALKKSKLDINDSNKPIASFLFAGTTGVGKTETAKVLSEEYFGQKSLIKLDMSEYQTSESIQKMIGSPPGYVGYTEGGKLTNLVNQNPYTVVLFDEIEKAHPDVLNVLLQILDDGVLTDNTGKNVNFKNTIIIMTTNIGYNVFQKNSLGFSEMQNSKKKDALAEIKKALRPELFNRISDVVVFNALTKTDCEKITEIYMKELVDKLKNKSIDISYSASVLNSITEKGYNEHYGAREIRRTFEKEISSKLADILFENDNADNLKIYVEDDEIKIKVKALVTV